MAVSLSFGSTSLRAPARPRNVLNPSRMGRLVLTFFGIDDLEPDSISGDDSA
jgi:hypothetical protein